ncbi:MAG: hypothetical protein MZV63_44450 [Marinilabiliales bacterium]|nr:hypothetical protein [Marinilabiliales bacterium]
MDVTWNRVVESAPGGGMRLTSTIEGRQCFSVNARFGQDFRQQVLRSIRRTGWCRVTGLPARSLLQAVADIRIND